MISTKEAEKLILSLIPLSKSKRVDIEALDSFTLRQRCFSDRSYPPFDRVALDGIATHYQQYQKYWCIQEMQKAGEPPTKLLSHQNGIEIMTGAVLPEGCDTVLRYEDLIIKDGQASLKEGSTVRPFLNVHRTGTDCDQGDLLFDTGTRLTPVHWGALAAIGSHSVEVSCMPRIALVSTGDELVGVRAKPAAHQIRASNSYALLSALRSFGFRHITLAQTEDSSSKMQTLFDTLLNAHDLLIVSGGVSAGKFDLVPTVLREIGVTQVFHKIRQKPGKPFWFGMGAPDKPVFGLPGNPQASLICLYRYVLPALRKMQGLDKQRPLYAKLSTPCSKKFHPLSEMTRFVPVSAFCDEHAMICAHTIETQGSGDFISLSKSKGFVEIPENELFHEGHPYPLYLWTESSL